MNVYEKLQKARIELQSKTMKKSGHNKFAGYQYFELGDFLPEINKLFSELKLCSVVSFGKDLAELKVINIEKPEEVVTFTSPMAEANLKGCHPIQNLGAVETYNRRYLYVTALEIVEHDALDSAPPVEAGNAPKAAKGVIKPTSGAGEGLTQEQVNKVNEAVKKVTDWLTADSVEDAVLEKWNANLDADETVYFWTFFDSKQRSAMTKEFERQKKKQLERDAATQP
jgi:hypothetical protein